MQLREIRTFELVAQEGNMTKAAALMSKSVMAVSKQISNLEHSVGQALFIRTRRELKLTEYGREFLKQLTDISTNETVAVSNSAWHCKVLHEAPLNKQCETELNPTAGTAPCDYTSTEAPSGWKKAGFDVSEWPNATEYSAAMVSPKDGYNLISWDERAKLIWGDDLETSNTLICKFTVEKP